MKLVVLNGSPKGDVSVTIHSIKYLQKRFPKHDFDILQIAKRIKGIERKPETFDGIIEEIAVADGLLWAFPLYLLMVPAPLKRFFPMLDVPTHAMAATGTVGMKIPMVRAKIQEMLKHGVSFRHRKIVEDVTVEPASDAGTTE